MSGITGREISTDDVANGEVVGNGVRFGSAGFLQIDKTSSINAANVDYDGALTSRITDWWFF